MAPSLLPGPCKWPGCPQVTKEQYCEEHRKQAEREYERHKRREDSRLYNYRWQKARIIFLRQHPLCAECLRQGRVTPATVVDHIVPHRGDRNLFWDTDNWQALCKPCHDAKTAREDGGFGNT